MTTITIPISQPIRVAPTAGHTRPVATSRPSATIVSDMVGNCAGLTMPPTVIACQSTRTMATISKGSDPCDPAHRCRALVVLVARSVCGVR